MENPVIRRALISVSDKTGLIELAKFLAQHNVELISTGGSAQSMRDAGLSVVDVADHTGFPEMLDGRVKTLHPVIHGGILGIRGNVIHEKAMAEHNIAPIDLVIVNLYPFEQTVATGADFAHCIENIDIGGPSLIRGAAKNHDHVAVIVDPSDYQELQREMVNLQGTTSIAFRRNLALRAYALTAVYDAAISGWLAGQNEEKFSGNLAIGAKRSQLLRYGENPHQKAAMYLSGQSVPGVARSQQIQGKELSYNNINDTDAAFELVSEFDVPAVAIIKHANPCGVATGSYLSDAWNKALSCDPVSAFGGVVAVNRQLDVETAKAITSIFTEVVIAPAADEEALRVFATKKNLRLLLTGAMPDPRRSAMTIKTIAGGLLLQERDNGMLDPDDLKCVTKRTPNKQELADLLFAFRVCKHVKSNAIVYAKSGMTVGIGAGQMSRVDSARIAASKSREIAENSGQNLSGTIGSVVASDAFFPFADGLLVAADAGATAAIQPGGSVRDEEVIAAANDRGMAMIFTGMRHFRH